MPHALIVDAQADAGAAHAALAASAGFSTATACTLAAAREELVRAPPDFVLLDPELPDGDGLMLLRQDHGAAAGDVVLVTSRADLAVAGLRCGAVGHLARPVDPDRLRAALARVPRVAELRADVAALRAELRRLGHFGALVGRSAPMQALYDEMERAAPTGAPVLLAGESGTGKDLAARALHDLSRRRHRRFCAVACAAIAPALLEGQLFGNDGWCARAEGGTLYLDDVASLPGTLQHRLLQMLETGRRVGEDGTARASDVRLLAAMRGDPEQAVVDGVLREDLYRQLSGFALRLPPLRERATDVPLLAQHFLDRLNEVHGTHKVLPAAEAARLAAMPWPGNVRDLRNHVEKAFILDGAGVETPAAAPATPMVTVPVGMSLDDANRHLVLATLEQCGGVKKWAAELLGVSLKTLYNRLEEYRAQGLLPPRAPARDARPRRRSHPSRGAAARESPRDTSR